jgi:hypothetical protein
VAASGTAQAFGSAITYARRYSLAPALGIATEEDVDAPAAERPAEKPAAKAAPDLHQQAWEYAVTKAGDDAQALFLDGLADAGIKAGGRIANAAQSKAVRAYIDGKVK